MEINGTTLRMGRPKGPVSASQLKQLAAQADSPPRTLFGKRAWHLGHQPLELRDCSRCLRRMRRHPFRPRTEPPPTAKDEPPPIPPEDEPPPIPPETSRLPQPRNERNPSRFCRWDWP